MWVTKVAKAEFPHPAYSRIAWNVRESVGQKLQDDYRAQRDFKIAGAYFYQLHPDSIIRSIPISSVCPRTPSAAVGTFERRHSSPYRYPYRFNALSGTYFRISQGDHLWHRRYFHVDYNIDPSSEPLIYDVIAQLKTWSRSFSQAPDPESSRNGFVKGQALTCPFITIGYATLAPMPWRDLEAISDLSITLVGLLQSDMFMQGRTFKETPSGASYVCLTCVAKNYGLEIAMLVNNVDTPQGSVLIPCALLGRQFLK